MSLSSLVPKHCAVRITELVAEFEVGLRPVCIQSVALPTALDVRYWMPVVVCGLQACMFWFTQDFENITIICFYLNIFHLKKGILILASLKHWET